MIGLIHAAERCYIDLLRELASVAGELGLT